MLSSVVRSSLRLMVSRHAVAVRCGPAILQRSAAGTELVRRYKTTDFYDHRVTNWLEKDVLPVSVGDLVLKRDPNEPVTQEEMIENAGKVQHEVAVRLARRINKIHMLPYIVIMSPAMKLLLDLYSDAFYKLIDKPAPSNAFQERQLTTKLFPTLLDSTSVVLPTLARATLECRGLLTTDELTEFMDSILVGRIYRRTLVGNHMRLSAIFENIEQDDDQKFDTDGYVLSMSCNLSDIANKAFYDFTKPIVLNKYNVCPDMDIVSKQQPTFCYVGRHIEIILIELFKNSASAAIEHHRQQGLSDDTIPPISVEIHFVGAMATILIHDKGGGTKHKPHELFQYAFPYTEKETEIVEVKAYPRFENGTLAREMKNEGFGLPMVQQYARFFGGDVDIQVVDGVGCDTYVRLPDLSKIDRRLKLTQIDD